MLSRKIFSTPCSVFRVSMNQPNDKMQVRTKRSRQLNFDQREEMKMSRNKNPGTVSRRTLLQAGAGLAGGALLPSRIQHCRLCGRRFPADRHLAGRLQGRHGQHRRRGAAHRHLRGAGRGRAQGLAARRRAHQQRRSADQEDRAEGHQGRARQEGQSAVRRLGRQAEPGGAGACRPSSTRTRSS